MSALTGAGDEASASEAVYFVNHARRTRFPWTLYHDSLARSVGAALTAHGPRPRVLTVGCGFEPWPAGAPALTECFGCDLDARVIAKCAELNPALRDNLAACPGPYELPSGGGFDEPFDVVLAKEVIEHTDDPARWARGLAAKVREGGELVLTTPNYGALSTLPLIERTVLELVARKDGYSRAHIHPSKFDAGRLAMLDVGPGMTLRSVERTGFDWALVGRWVRTGAGA